MTILYSSLKYAHRAPGNHSHPIRHSGVDPSDPLGLGLAGITTGH